MALLMLGGVRPPRVGEAVDHVLTVADRVSADDAGDQVELFESIRALKEQREGPGPHRHRLGALIFEMTQRQSVEVKHDLFDTYVETLEGLNGLVHSGTRTSLGDARKLLDEAFAIAGRLFAPISMRFDAIDALVMLAKPTAEDVDQLKTRGMFGPNDAMGVWAIQRLQSIHRLHVDAGTQALDQLWPRFVTCSA
jgi:hypothetical protein